MKRALSPLLVLGALGAASGCDTRAGEDYQGESLLTISGSVVVNNDLAPTNLVPALAFLHGEEDAFLRIQDVEVAGEFPASFTLDVFEPPPPDVIHYTEVGQIPIAVGFIAAVSPDHPANVEIPKGDTDTSCFPLDPGDPTSDGICETTREHCVNQGRECYVETTRCELRIQGDETVEVCNVVATSGDPALGRRLWKHFAGVSSGYVVLYVGARIAPHSSVAEAYPGSEAYQVGYNLIGMRPFTPAELEANAACRDQANADAFARYNAEHGTSYRSIADIPDQSFDVVNGEIEATEHELKRERRCRGGTKALSLVSASEARDLTVEIGPDVEPPLF